MMLSAPLKEDISLDCCSRLQTMDSPTTINTRNRLYNFIGPLLPNDLILAQRQENEELRRSLQAAEAKAARLQARVGEQEDTIILGDTMVEGLCASLTENSKRRVEQKFYRSIRPKIVAQEGEDVLDPTLVALAAPYFEGGLAALQDLEVEYQAQAANDAVDG